jgi:hypothetical protein
MNRRDRRAAAARARRSGGRTGYEHRLMSAGLALADQLRGKVVYSIIEHDQWCGIYRGKGCNCVPNMSLVPDGGREAFVVETNGTVRTTRRQ